MYGPYHNEFLEIYYEKYANQENKDFKVMCNNILTEFELKYPNLISEEEKFFYAERVDEIFGTNTKLENINFNEVFNNAASSYYSLKMQTFLIDIFEKNESPEIIYSRINTLRQDSTLSSNEIGELDKFESVLEASILFWQDRVSSKVQKCNPKHQIFIGDAASMMFGGWVALIISAFVAESQDQHGGGCI